MISIVTGPPQRVLLLLSDDRSCTGLFALLYCLPQHLGLVHVRSQALFLSFLLLGGEGVRFKKKIAKSTKKCLEKEEEAKEEKVESKAMIVPNPAVVVSPRRKS